MESKTTACFLARGFVGAGLVRFHASNCSNRLLPASCRMRRNFSMQNKRHHLKKTNLDGAKHKNLKPNGSSGSDPNNLSKGRILDPSPEMASNSCIPMILESRCSEEKDNNNSSPPDNIRSVNHDIDSAGGSSCTQDEDMISYFPSNDIQPAAIDEGEQLPAIHLQDLLGMIRNAEKNIHLLNQARIRALEDLEKILCEKKALQGEVNILEMKMAETNAPLTVTAEEKFHVEVLEDQLVKIQNGMPSSERSEKAVQGINNLFPSSKIVVESISQELSLLRAENASLKDELWVLKDELSNFKETDEHIQLLKKERSILESSLKELELKVASYQEEASEFSSLKLECKILHQKVQELQTLLGKATNQGNQATSVMQQNQDLLEKVEQLEESLSEANAYKLSSEKMQRYNKLMQQKVKVLDERLQRSDEEINSHLLLFQDSMKEFQDTLNHLKEKSKKREKTGSVHDKPLEFWSSLLLKVDGWFLEKKISLEEVNQLREMIWSREKGICDAYMSSKEKKDSEMIVSFLKLISSKIGERLHVIHIAAEMAPVAKVGGLGDVVTGLSKALQKKGHLVEVILPKYDCMNVELIADLKALEMTVESYFDGQLFKNKIWIGTVEGLPVYFIEPQHPAKFFWRGQVYGEHDDFKRFSFFSRAALELLLQAGKKPNIIHCHDWQTAFVAPLYWDLYVPRGLNSAKICFTCHNFEYQGAASASNISSCGLDANHMNRPDRMQDNSAHDRINPVKGAIVFSNIVTTVSPSYAQEVRTAEGGRGLHSTLNSHLKKFMGILNGIDTDAWNPATDPFLKAQYNANDIEGKEENKQALRRTLGMSSANIRQPLGTFSSISQLYPKLHCTTGVINMYNRDLYLVACIVRLVPQKGVHLIRHAIYRTLDLGGQFILLGSSPVPQIQREFEDISNQFKAHDHARLVLKYDESLAHLIFAASDMFIIPSIFEPCGLTQMIAMRYGSIPIARRTGGLNDSVFDVHDDTVPVRYRNGFTFVNANELGFNEALQRAFQHYHGDVNGWKQLVQNDMIIDFSWNSSASLYEELYQKSLARAKAGNYS